MLTRAGILESFGLPDRDAFEIEPHRDDQGIWRIKVSHEGDPNIHMSPGHAKNLVDVIRSLDPHLGETNRLQSSCT